MGKRSLISSKMQLRTARLRCRRAKTEREATSSSSNSSPEKNDMDFHSYTSVRSEVYPGTSINRSSAFAWSQGYGTSSGTSLKDSEDIDNDSSCERVVIHKLRKKSTRKYTSTSSDSGISSARTSSQRSWRIPSRPSTKSEPALGAELHNTSTTHLSWEEEHDRFPSKLITSSFGSETSRSTANTYATRESVTQGFKRKGSRMHESPQLKRKRWHKTVGILKNSGLLDITIKTADLMRKNQTLQRDIENLQKETNAFVASVLSNPENRQILENVQFPAQLYETVVPGSKNIMMKAADLSVPSPFTLRVTNSPEDRAVYAKNHSPPASPLLKHLKST